MSDRIPWQSGSLWPRLKAQRKHGLRAGALQPAKTVVDFIDSGGVRFVVYVLASLSLKEQALKDQLRAEQVNKTSANPFLPYEQDLYVTDISKTHLCLLNKFNVVDHHFLIVTRQYEPQENWLTVADFEALVRCLSEVDGIAFFNGGPAAGSSQPHKHLQVVPYAGEQVDFSMEEAIATAEPKPGNDDLRESSLFPFVHAIALTDQLTPGSTTPQANDHTTAEAHLQASAQKHLTRYHQLLNAVGIVSQTQWQGLQTAAYNLLCTRNWMMVVPRSQEKYAGISVNSLGFVGSLLVKDDTALEQLEAIGPMHLLQQVSFNR